MDVPAWTAVPLLLAGAAAAWLLRGRLLRLFDRALAGAARRPLVRPLPAFHRADRRVLVASLAEDAEVQAAAERACAEQGLSLPEARARARLYASEIVPAFRAGLYFGPAMWVASRVLPALYRLRAGRPDEAALAAVNPGDGVILVSNHRSNVDYVFIAYLARSWAPLNYAVGEWARVWPLRPLIHALGGYFVRRGTGDALYRKVLERYVQRALEGGVVQAVFPEGRLSRDGTVGEPRIGLLDYTWRRFDPDGPHDVVFLPVALNYDRVLEDRALLLEEEPEGGTVTARTALWTAARFAAKNLWLGFLRRRYRFGYACANFGAPLSLRATLREEGVDPRSLDREERAARVRRFADGLMGAVRALTPVLPVSLVARELLRAGGGPMSRSALERGCLAAQRSLAAAGATVHVPRGSPAYGVEVGLRMLVLRRLVESGPAGIRVVPEQSALVRFYANAIAHLG